KSQRALVEQLRRDEQVTANLAANVVYNSLRYRVQRLATEAARAELARALLADGPATGPEDNDARRRLNQLLDDMAEDRRGLQGVDGTMFTLLTLADADGHIVGEWPRPHPELWSRRWAWRDWFGGKGHHFDEPDGRFDPVKDVYVSQPYVSRAAGNAVMI